MFKKIVIILISKIFPSDWLAYALSAKPNVINVNVMYESDLANMAETHKEAIIAHLEKQVRTMEQRGPRVEPTIN